MLLAFTNTNIYNFSGIKYVFLEEMSNVQMSIQGEKICLKQVNMATDTTHKPSS